MSSPQRSEVAQQIENEIRSRVSYYSPSKNDIDFYQRKVNRLEADLTHVQQELSVARLRLRTAEDFEIKYELLLKQNSSLTHENSRLNKELARRTLEEEKLINQKNSFLVSRADYERQISKRNEELQDLRNKLYQIQKQAEETKKNDKSHLGLQNEVALLKKDKDTLQAQLNSQTFSLRKKLGETELEVIHLRQKLERKDLDLEHQQSRFNEQLSRLRQEFEKGLKEKSQELERLRESHQLLNSVSLDELKDRIQEKDENFKSQLSILNQLIQSKNQQIQTLIKEKQEQGVSFEQDATDFKEHIKFLEEKIYERERENQLELYNMKERLTKLHAEQITNREKGYQESILSFEQEVAFLKSVLVSKDAELELVGIKHQEQKQAHKQKEDDLKRAIIQLKDRIHEHNKTADSQHQILTSVNLNLQLEQKATSSNYENNITFLDHQLKKANLSIEQKNIQINKLLNELTQVKKECEDQIRQASQKWRLEKKDLINQQDRCLKEKKAKDDELKRKQKELRAKDRELEEILSKTNTERKSLERVFEQVQRDCKRLADDNKDLERALRDQRQRNVGSVGQLNNIRRDKLGQLERQKNDLEAIFREQMDQVKNGLSLQIDKLRVERDRLKAQLQRSVLEYQQLEQNFKKVSSLVANQAKNNKEKLAEYQKKMATLNTEISLTQNLYNTFLDAKSRLQKSRENKQN